jgi:hypothetical protein
VAGVTLGQDFLWVLLLSAIAAYSQFIHLPPMLRDNDDDDDGDDNNNNNNR